MRVNQIDTNGDLVRPRKIALIFDDQARPETTGVYCRRALGTLAEAAFFHPSRLAEVPRTGFDLYLNIDDGMRYLWPGELRPCAWWAIDTHLDFEWCLRKAKGFDFVFAAQRDGAEHLRREGITSAQWLPLACDVEIHGRQTMNDCLLAAHEPSPHLAYPTTRGKKKFDVCFIGNLLPGPRVDLLRLIQRHFKNTFVGQAYFEEMAAIYSKSRIVFNRSVAGDVNMRVFEALASGSLLLTNELDDHGQAELFRDGVHLATYRDGNELLDKLRYYLRRDEVREKIAAAGRAEVLAKHTYRTRMEEVLRKTANCKLKTVNCKLQIGATNGGRIAPYFDFARPEVLEIVPRDARRVLEIGCGAGRLGETLKQRQPCEVVGVERNLAAAEKAAERLDCVVVGDIERLEPDFGGARFDCLICADVLEHLVDPAGFLQRARAWLTSDAAVIASLPNVRHRALVEGLIEGNWCYEPAGLLDNTHLHFFTRRDVEALFIKAGCRIESFRIVPGAGYDEWRAQEDRSRLQIGRVALTGLPEKEAAEFFAYQFLVKAERSESIASRDELPRCLLLMVTYNRLEYTRPALEAVLKLDYKNLRLVVWDNASSDGTVDYVKQRLAGRPNAELIASPVNRGVVFPMNEVWSSDRQAELLAKVDNDTLVPPGLLSRLAGCHLQSKRFGVLSGFHFREEGERLAEANRIKSFDGVAVLPQPYVGGCAVMIRRDVFDRIGPIGCRTDSQPRPFMDSGWTMYQQRLTAEDLVNGYPWPPVHVDHMEDTRSPYCIRSDEHQRYKREERGMELDEFTNKLCVWRPNWSSERAGAPSSASLSPRRE